MGLKDFARSLRPGDDRALAARLEQEQRARAGHRAAAQAEAARAISNRDQRRTPQEVAASQARGRRHKRSRFEPPAPGINP